MHAQANIPCFTYTLLYLDIHNTRSAQRTHTPTYTRVHAYLHTRVHTYTHLHTHACTLTYTRARTQPYAQTQTPTHSCAQDTNTRHIAKHAVHRVLIHLHTHARTHLYTHARIHTYTNTNMRAYHPVLFHTKKCSGRTSKQTNLHSWQILSLKFMYRGESIELHASPADGRLFVAPISVSGWRGAGRWEGQSLK